jgi:hypothetical protein
MFFLCSPVPYVISFALLFIEDLLTFLKDFELEKIKKMLPSIKFQNGAQIQDGRQKVFIV